MAFWKELISQGLTKGKSLFLGGIEIAKSPQTHALFLQGGKKLVSGTKTAVGWAGKIGHWASEHPKTSVAGLAIALPTLGYDKGLLNFAKERIGGEETKDKGIANVAVDLALGKDVDENGKDKSISERTVNTVFGDGSYDTIKNAGGAVVDETTSLYQTGKNTVADVAGGVRNLYNDGRNMVNGVFDGNGMVSNGNGGYIDPTTQQYPSYAQLQQANNGMLSGFMGGMNNALDTVSGGNVSKMNLATLVLSAYMMFGRFGWLGKMASLMLGGMTLKNINNHHQSNMQPVQSQQQVQSQRQEQVPQYASYTPNNDEDNIVRMSRRL